MILHRFTDEIQIDKSYNKARTIIDRLNQENARLKDEITQLQNRPIVEPEVVKKEFIVKMTKDKLQDPIDAWNNHHFILYFQQKFKDKYSTHFSVKKKDWAAYSMRLSQFRLMNTKFGMDDNATFQRYIDWCFSDKFNDRGFIATIYALASDKLLMEYRISTGQTKKPASYDDLIGQVPKTNNKKREELLKDAF